MVYKHVVWGLVYLLVIGLPSMGGTSGDVPTSAISERI